jgi:hypothetical protein
MVAVTERSADLLNITKRIFRIREHVGNLNRLAFQSGSPNN